MDTEQWDNNATHRKGGIQVQTWLIYVDDKGQEKTHKMDTEESAKAFVISNIGSQPKDTLIKRIYVVDVDQGSMTELTYGLNGQVFEFREKSAE